MLARCPHSPQRGTGWLEGWRLTFGGEDMGWDGALTTVVEDAAQRVFVALYDVPESDEKELDSWDGFNLGYYRKLKVRVQTLDGDALAWLYVLDGYEGGLPSARHVSILVDAAEKAGAPDDYVRWLRSRPSDPEARNAGAAWPALLPASTVHSRITITSAIAGMATAATPGQCQELTGERAGPVSSCATRSLSTRTTCSASPASAGLGAAA
jgi:AIG2-like family